MLIIKAFVNDKEIDEIRIGNTGKRCCDDEKFYHFNENYYFYEIVKPKHGVLVVHDRRKGWTDLVRKAFVNIAKYPDQILEENWCAKR